MPNNSESDWIEIYETRSTSDADIVRTTLEVAGFQVSMETAPTDPFSAGLPARTTISVPGQDADDARAFLKDKTSLLSQSPTSAEPAAVDPATGNEIEQRPSVEDIANEVLDLRRQHEVAACKYCGIATLDISELDLDSRMVALLRVAGLGVNSATYSEFEPGERICSECAGHEVACEVCARVTDAFIDGGEYQASGDDEAYVCSLCIGRLEDRMQSSRDW